MGNIYMIIYFGGLIGGVIGPLDSLGMEGCKKEAIEMQEHYDVARSKYPDLKDQPIIKFTCEEHKIRPKTYEE